MNKNAEEQPRLFFQRLRRGNAALLLNRNLSTMMLRLMETKTNFYLASFMSRSTSTPTMANSTALLR